MVSVQPNVPYIWIPDSHTERCTGCKAPFSLMNRKHHCRLCGRIFCSECLPFKQSLPSIHETYLAPTLPQKCCHQCNTTTTNIKQNRLEHIVLMNLPLTMKELEMFLYLNKRWNRAVSFIIGVFKSIQYKLPYQKWTYVQRTLLLVHFQELRYHSRYLVQALKCLCKTTDLNQLMDTSVRVPCEHLYCDKFCCESPSVYDLVDLLYNKPMVLEYDKVYEWVEGALNTVHIDSLTLLLPWLMQMGLNRGVQRLIKRVFLPMCDNMNFAYKFYFECKMLQQTRNKDFYVSILQSVVLRCRHYPEIQNTERFISNITNKVYTITTQPRMPYDPSIVVESVMVDKIQTLNSFTKPTKIPMKTNRGVRNVLVKNEDVRTDRLAIIMMYLMNQYDDFNLVPYNIFVVSKSSGWIEMVDGVKSLCDINRTSTLQNYILSNNKDKSIDVIRRTFIKSCASNCILTYVLGVGDRNLNNIIVDKRGTIINIDFSYVLGHDPKYEPCEMRITKGMLDMLGGKNSLEYQQFRILSTSMYKQVRAYNFFWYTFLKYIVDAKPNIDHYHGSLKELRQHVEHRFMLNSDNEEVDIFIAETVDKNSDQTWTSMLSDASVNVTTSVRTVLDGFLFNLEI